MLQKRLAWALFVFLSTLVFCQPKELIWAFLFHKFSHFTHPSPAPCGHLVIFPANFGVNDGLEYIQPLSIEVPGRGDHAHVR